MSDKCIFCQIVAGKLPCYKVYEDKDFLGFLDIAPLNPGNSLLVPRKHYRWVYDIPNFGQYWEAAKKVALAIQKAVNAHSVNFLTLGYEVLHAHIRIIPRFDDDGHNDGIRLSAVKKIPEEKMRETAQNIREKVKNV